MDGPQSVVHRALQPDWEIIYPPLSHIKTAGFSSQTLTAKCMGKAYKCCYCSYNYCKRLDPFAHDIKMAILGVNFKVSRSTEQINIDENSIIYEHQNFYFLFYIKYNFHRLFALLSGETLKLSPKVAILMSCARWSMPYLLKL